MSSTLFFDACKSGDLNLIKLLIIHKTSKKLNSHFSKQLHSSTSINKGLIEAIRYGHLEVVKYLVLMGANIHYANDYAICLSSERGHLEIVKYLITKGANFRANDDVAIRYAAEKGHLEVVKYLHIQGSNINAKDSWVIYFASIHGYLKIVKYAVENGGIINNYSLLNAWNFEQFEVVKYLAEKNAPFSAGVSEQCLNYLSFCKRIKEKNKIRAQKKLYYWWIPICYDMKRECGKRMGQHSLNLYKKLLAD